MAQYICHKCNQTRSSGSIAQCGKCRKILCDQCRDGDVNNYKKCEELQNGVAGCEGKYAKLP